MSAPVIAYSVKEAARTTGVSESLIRAAYRSGLLPVRYPATAPGQPPSVRPVVLHDDLMAWLSNSPTERASA